MFTIDQIKSAHSKVKSGADFPNYIQEMKSLGVKSYEHFVSDGHILYCGSGEYKVSAEAKWTPIEVVALGSKEKLQQSLVIHQKGQTDYVTFCKQSAEAGVEKWVVDMIQMVCIYYDKSGNEILVEKVPTP